MNPVLGEDLCFLFPLMPYNIVKKLCPFKDFYLELLMKIVINDTFHKKLKQQDFDGFVSFVDEPSSGRRLMFPVSSDATMKPQDATNHCGKALLVIIFL